MCSEQSMVSDLHRFRCICSVCFCFFCCCRCSVFVVSNLLLQMLCFCYFKSAVADIPFLLFYCCCLNFVQPSFTTMLLVSSKCFFLYSLNIQTFPQVYVLYFQIVLNAVKPVELNGCSCSCAAGMALCNHVVALLFQTAHYSTMGLKTVPTPLSCTGVLQSCHRPRTQVSLSDASCVIKFCSAHCWNIDSALLVQMFLHSVSIPLYISSI